MKTTKTMAVVPTLGLVTLLASTPLATAGDPWVSAEPRFPVRVALISPIRAQDRSIQYHAGWPLTFRIIPRVDVSLIVPSVPGGPASAWPEVGATSFMMLRDLDDCPSAGGRIIDPDGMPICPDISGDELWLEFTPDEDAPGVADESGDDALREAMKDPARRSTVTFMGETHTFGPRVSDTRDGLGFGANDDLPGFVLLADAGVGVMLSDLGTTTSDGATLTTGWAPLAPAVSRNLAGFMTSVGYELNDERLRTTITTSLIVPRHLTERRFLEDQCFEAVPGVCETYRRVDGGPPVPATDANLDNYDVTLRAFVVQGEAPDTLIDCDADGVVTADDATCMGYDVLSRERVLTFRQIGRADECNLLSDPWGSAADAGRSFVDFDGNGNFISLSCPGGSTGGGLPPRQRGSER
ncbi:MAG: hypothetical protein AAF270_14710 [Pseudomonadota bacterium]